MLCAHIPKALARVCTVGTAGLEQKRSKRIALLWCQGLPLWLKDELLLQTRPGKSKNRMGQGAV